MDRKYIFKEGRQVPKIDAQDVGEELERIREKHGMLQPRTVVTESRPKEAVLHPVFDWNNKEAADKWRDHQARNIINVVNVIEDKAPDNEVSAFVNVVLGPVSDPENRHYMAMRDVLDDPVQRAKLIQQALEKLVRVQREFRHLKELAVVWSAIDDLVEKETTATV